MQNLRSIAIALVALGGCATYQYQHHPAATVVSVVALSAAPAGICIGIGECGGDNGHSWQNEAARYGVAQISVVAAIAAAFTLACLSENAWHWDGQ